METKERNEVKMIEVQGMVRLREKRVISISGKNQIIAV